MSSNDYQRRISDEKRKRRIKRWIIELLVSAVLIIPAIIICINLKKLVTDQILSTIELQPNSEGFQKWLDPPVTTTRSYYLFNVSNPIEIVTDPSSATIQVKDTPPYTYKIKSNKNNVRWSKENTKIDYEVERIFTRDPDHFKPSSVNDTGVFVDMLRAIFRTQFGPKPTDAFYPLGGMDTFYHRNAIEQLEGFTSDLFNMMRDKMVGPNTDKSGFVYRQNGSRLYNVSIHSDSIKKGQVQTFENELVKFTITNSSHYPFPIYDSLTYPPMLLDKRSLNIFNSDFCSPVLLQFNREVEMYGGINMYEYKIKLIDIKNCSDPNDTTTCPVVDKLDVSECISASIPEKTIFLSKAHFYGSSNETIQEMNIEGFNPSSDKHDSVIYFEPYSGTPFKAFYRMQLNIDATIDTMRIAEDGFTLEPVKKNKGVKRLLPIFWIDQDVTISQEIINKLRRIHFGLRFGRYIIMGIAISLSIGFIVLMEYLAKRSARNEQNKGGTYITADTVIQH